MKSAEMTIEPEKGYRNGETSPPQVHNVNQSEVQANPGVAFIDPLPKVPAELKQVPRWLVWKCEGRNGKPTKVPYSAKSRTKASTTDQATWADYATAASTHAGYEGLGCVIAEPYVGIDLDKCRNPENGEIEPWAEAIIKELHSYTELSPSGCGLHIWVKGNLPSGGNRKGRVEMYDHCRYFTVTGKHLPGTPETIEERDLSSLHSRLETLDPENKKPPKSVTSANAGTSRFKSLMTGKWEGLYTSQSEADMALCVMLAKKCACDPQKIDTEFRKSGLYRDKWERLDYSEDTINKAIEFARIPVMDFKQYESQETRAGSGGSPPATAELDCKESLIPPLWRKAASFATLPEKKFEWIVADLIPADGITVATGDFGSFKTYVSYFLADAIAGGGKFVDRPCQQHPVLFLDRENSHSTVYLRRSLVGNLKTRDNVRILGLFTDPTAPEVSHPDLLAICAGVKPVIIIDSLTDFHPGLKESDPDDMTECFRQIRDMVTAGAAAVVVLHHVPKNGNGKGGQYRGSTSIPAAGTSALLIQKVRKNTAKIAGFKTRDGEDQTIELKLNFGAAAVTYQVIKSGRDPDAELRDRIEDYVRQNDGCSANDVANALGKRKRTVLATINAMVRTGRLVRTGRGSDAALHAGLVGLSSEVVPEGGNQSAGQRGGSHTKTIPGTTVGSEE